MTGNNEATPIIVGGLVADFCFHKDVDLNKTRFPNYATLQNIWKIHFLYYVLLQFLE